MASHSQSRMDPIRRCHRAFCHRSAGSLRAVMFLAAARQHLYGIPQWSPTSTSRRRADVRDLSMWGVLYLSSARAAGGRPSGLRASGIVQCWHRHRHAAWIAGAADDRRLPGVVDHRLTVDGLIIYALTVRTDERLTLIAYRPAARRLTSGGMCRWMEWLASRSSWRSLMFKTRTGSSTRACTPVGREPTNGDGFGSGGTAPATDPRLPQRRAGMERRETCGDLAPTSSRRCSSPMSGGDRLTRQEATATVPLRRWLFVPKAS